jgi:selenocysteine-specific elongation factor
LDALKEQIRVMAEAAGQKSLAKPFRIPVDRVFSMEGFGTVITGTMIEGTLRDGEEITLYPSAREVRVRGIQVHSRPAAAAYAGQRVAVNLSGVKKEEVSRGDVLAARGSLTSSLMLDVKLKCLKDSGRVILNGSRVHFYHGAREALCKVALLEGDSLGPGQEGYAQLRFTEPVAAKQGDRFVVRFYSPIDTIGGGVILDALPPRRRRGSESVIAGLKIREEGSPTDRLVQAIADGSPRFAPAAEAARAVGMTQEDLKAALAELSAQGRILPLSGKVYIDAEFKARTEHSLVRLLSDYHRANPLQPGMRRDELRQKLLPGRERALADRLLSMYEADGVIRAFDQRAALAGFEITYSPADRRLRDFAEETYKKGGYSPPDLDEVLESAQKEKAALRQVVDAMLASGDLVMATPQILFHATVAADALCKIRDYTAQRGKITLAEFRDLAGTSRKYAVALLEYFDRKGVTRKEGDARVLSAGL